MASLFGISSTQDYLKAADAQVQRLKALQDRLLTQPERQATQAEARALIGTIWHAIDWIYKDPTPAFDRMRKNLGDPTFDQFRSIVTSQSNALRICREFANVIKHRRFATTASVADANASAVAAVSIAEIYFPWNRGKVRSRPKLILRDGRRLRAVDVYEEAISDWKTMLASHGIVP
jgi:hypothetical protein